MNSLAAGNGRIITLPKTAELADIPGDTPVSNRLTTASQLSNLNLNSLTSGTYYASSNLAISPSSLMPNQHLTIVVLNSPTNPNASVTITGNITDNNATYSSLDQIPSLTIIANHIYVSGNVTELYGTYIARDRFNTCNDPSLSSQTGFNLNQTLAGIGNSSDGAWSAACKNQLTITGALISKNRPSFLRTNGAGRDDTSTPAEIIQYSPNLYLTPYALSQLGDQVNWRLMDLKQLPARL
jgi:hypothetical protein